MMTLNTDGVIRSVDSSKADWLVSANGRSDCGEKQKTSLGTFRYEKLLTERC